MSIIYKALQKTQRKREHENHSLFEPNDTVTHHSYWFDAILLVIIAILLTVVIIAYYPRMHFFAKAAPVIVKPQLSPQAVKEAAFKSQYHLNGIFVSDQNIIAMINNQYFHLGDIVGDMKIISITDKSVRLKNQDQVIELEVSI